MLIAARAMLAAELLLALLPTPIMLFMGDEFRRAEPVSVLLRLQRRARRCGGGRSRRETLALFGDAFPSPLPSPIAAETQRAAVLDWTATQREPHASTLARMRAWLGLRRSALFPRLPARAERGALLGERALEATWRLADGARLHVVANLDDVELRGSEAAGEPLACTRAPRPGSALPPWHVCWTLERG